MPTKRIIPCLDVKNGRVVKGVNFINLRDAGSAVELARRYYEEGADELVFLDITATLEKRQALENFVREVAKELRIPFTVGGGISSLEDIDILLKAGADKVSLNSVMVSNPEFISRAAEAFGSQAIVGAVDIKNISGVNSVFIKSGTINTGLEGTEWCKKVVDYGAGELLITSMNHDGTKSGYDIDFLKEIKNSVSVPIIASGGAGSLEHFSDAFIEAGVDACLAASLFHYGEINIKELKMYLKSNSIDVRL